MTVLELCADFSAWSVNLSTSPRKVINNMVFEDLPGPPDALSVVQNKAGFHALQFPESGLEVKLPIPVAEARLRVGQESGVSYTIHGVNYSGAEVSTITVNSPGTDQNVTLPGPDLYLIRFLGGANEGRIVHVCISIPIRDGSL